MTKLETDRLILRPCILEDFEGYAVMAADPDVMRYLSVDGKPLSRFAAWQSFSGQVGHWSLRGFGMFTVIERASGDFVGRVGPWRTPTYSGETSVIRTAAASIDEPTVLLENPPCSVKACSILGHVIAF